MTKALDRNGREIRVGDRVHSGHYKVVGINETFGTIHIQDGIGLPFWSSPEHYEIADVPPLVKDADGNELRVGDSLDSLVGGWTILSFEGDDLVETQSPTGTVKMVRAADCRRLSPPLTTPSGTPTPEDAAAGQQTRAMGTSEDEYVSGQAWIGETLRAWLPAALGFNVTYCSHSETYLVEIMGWRDTVVGVPRSVVEERDDDALMRFVDPSWRSRRRGHQFDAGHIAAYAAATGQSHDTIGAAAKGLYNQLKRVEEKHGFKVTPLDNGVTIMQMVGARDTSPVPTDAHHVRRLAAARVHERYATCDWDDPVRIADAEDYVVGQLGLVLRVERDFATVAEFGPNFRTTHGDLGWGRR